eukprot:946960-Rhodomonas_salina.2
MTTHCPHAVDLGLLRVETHDHGTRDAVRSESRRHHTIRDARSETGMMSSRREKGGTRERGRHHLPLLDLGSSRREAHWDSPTTTTHAGRD